MDISPYFYLGWPIGHAVIQSDRPSRVLYTVYTICNNLAKAKNLDSGEQ